MARAITSCWISLVPSKIVWVLSTDTSSLLRGHLRARNARVDSTNRAADTLTPYSILEVRVRARNLPAQTLTMSKRTLSHLGADLQTEAIGPLWSLDDLAAYLHCSDPTAATRVPGFPAALRIPGVRGPRWHASSVDEFYRRLSLRSLEPVAETPHRLPPMRQPSVKELKERVG
jgi:hypothetical protein